MIRYETYRFNELSNDQLYQVLQLRNEVFIVEQNAPYQDLDNKDQDAFHFLYMDNNTIVGYGRTLFDIDKKAISLGRLITKQTHRSKGIAKKLMQKMLSTLNKNHPQEDIVISAQSYLENFYQSFGFITTGEEYLEDGLPHKKMIKYTSHQLNG